MQIGPYGRQWFSPNCSEAFDLLLIEADKLVMENKLIEALRIYNGIKHKNTIAQRRLNIAKKQMATIHHSNYQAKEKDVVMLGFVDWFPDFRETLEHILSIFARGNIIYKVVSPEKADVLVAGCYGDYLLQSSEISKDKLVIFFCGENLGPSYNIHDFSITCRSHDYAGKNIRHPQWYGDFIFKDDGFEFRTSKEPLHTSSSRQFLISSIYNNATPEREEVISLLKQVFGQSNVHIFGSQRTGPVNKHQILSQSVINVCFENSLGEGYITEKLLHALAFNCKCLYWGDPSFRSDFTNQNIFNYHENHSHDALIQWCQDQFKKIESPKAKWSELDANIFTQKPHLNYISQSLVRWMNFILGWRNPNYLI